MHKYDVQNNRVRWRKQPKVYGSGNQAGRAETINLKPPVIPSQRVLGADGGLHGYGAGKGVETKAWLLDLEGAEHRSGNQ